MWVNKRQTDGISDGISLYNEHNRKKPHRNYLDPNFTYVLESKISFVSQLANKVGFDFRCTDWDPVKLELNFDDTENISKLIHLKNLKCQPVRGQKFTARDRLFHTKHQKSMQQSMPWLTGNFVVSFSIPQLQEELKVLHCNSSQLAKKNQ